jgi:hypothetical protein
LVIKPKFYKVALVATAIVLMLVSTAGAFPFCGCGYGCGDHSWAHTTLISRVMSHLISV